MSDVDARQIERMKALLEAQRAAFRDEPRRPVEQRRRDLDALERMVEAKGDAFAEAIGSDYGRRSPAETAIAETSFMLAAARHARKHVARWADSRPAPVPMKLKPGQAYVRREPKGVVGIIAPWNYPMQLALAPLVAALAAGCRAMIKPSEHTPATAELLKETLAEIYAEDHVAVITGGPAVGEAFSGLPFDHLFYTGSTHVGRLVAEAAARNLTPATLELGGKSPAVIAPDFDLKEAAKTLAWGKFFNAGQTCVAPDYLLVPKGREREMGEAIMAQAAEYWPDPGSNPDYTSIVSGRHRDRLQRLVEEARESGAEVMQAEMTPSNEAPNAFPPTVVIKPDPDLTLMREEIFGPVLPVLGYDGLADAARFIGERDHPLALYVYAKSKRTARQVIASTQSGGVSVNVPMLHLSIEDLPFGGVGASGYGAYHGERGFLEFTHERAVFEAPVWHPSRLIAPPYGRLFEFFKRL